MGSVQLGAVRPSLEEVVQGTLLHGVPTQRQVAGAQGLSLHPIAAVENITTTEFDAKFAAYPAPQPVIIRTSQADWLHEAAFSRAALTAAIGHIPLAHRSEPCRNQPGRPGSVCHSFWDHTPDTSAGGMEPHSHGTAADPAALGMETYGDLLRAQMEGGRAVEARGVAGGSLPPLQAAVRRPKFFPNNYLDVDPRVDADPASQLARLGSPAFSFGPAGTGPPLTRNRRMERTWVVQLHGSQLVRILSPSEAAAHMHDDSPHADWHTDSAGLFDVDLLRPDFDAHPHLHGAIVREGFLKAGDVLFVPEGWALQAVNLEWSCMVAGSYVDEHNVRLAETAAGVSVDAQEGAVSQQAPLLYAHLNMTTLSEVYFLPLVSRGDLAGKADVPLADHVRLHTLETAAISDAARAHVRRLRRAGVAPADWRDAASVSVLDVAVRSNYVALAAWLLEQGVPAPDAAVVRRCRARGMAAMADALEGKPLSQRARDPASA